MINILSKYVAQCWALGFVKNGFSGVMSDESLQVDWVKMPKDRWYADSFVLDVSDTEIQLLVEDYAYATTNGIISLLKIDEEHLEYATYPLTSYYIALNEAGHFGQSIVRKKISIWKRMKDIHHADMTYRYNPKDKLPAWSFWTHKAMRMVRHKLHL